jgi:hypothetical protein
MTLRATPGTNIPSQHSGLAASPTPLVAAAIDCTEIPPCLAAGDIRWIVKDKYARGRRPGYTGEGHKQVHREEVDKWITEATEFGIKSVICVLADDLLNLYADLPVDLVSYYRQSGLIVEHIPNPESEWPPMKAKDWKRALKARKQLPKPFLLLCNTGRDTDEEFWEDFERERQMEASKTRSKE